MGGATPEHTPLHSYRTASKSMSRLLMIRDAELAARIRGGDDEARNALAGIDG